MSTTGANAWSTELLINNLIARVDAAGGGGGGGISSVVAGPGIGVSTVSGAATVANTGVLSVLAGSGIAVATVDGSAVVTNGGVRTLAAGAGITVAGGSDATVANAGILSLTAGSGISITAGQNPTISAAPTPPPAAAVIDAAGGPVTVSVAQLPGCLIYSSARMPTGNTTFTLPGLAALRAAYGAGPVFLNFTIGVLNQYGGPYPPDSATVTVAAEGGAAWVQSDYPFGSSQGSPLVSYGPPFAGPNGSLTLAGGNMWRGSLYLDPTGSTAGAPGRAVYSFNFVGIIPQASI